MSDTSYMRWVNPLEEPEWDERLPVGVATPFHTSAWIRVLCETYRFAPLGLVAGHGGDWKPVLPVLDVRSALTGRRGIALPFTDLCAPMLSADVSMDQVMKACCELGRDRAWRYVELRIERKRESENLLSSSYVGHRLSLLGSEEDLLAGCSSSIRRGLRKADREGVEVMHANSESDLREFYRLQQVTRCRHGLPPQPYSFFRQLWRRVLLAGKGFLLLARWNEQVVAGAVYLRHGPIGLYKFGASDMAFQKVRPNNRIMWEAIRALRKEGCTELLFGRTDLGHEGLLRFKRGFGAVEYDIDYLQYDLKRERFVQDPTVVSDWQHRVFRRMPALVSRPVGAFLYRHVA